MVNCPRYSDHLIVRQSPQTALNLAGFRAAGCGHQFQIADIRQDLAQTTQGHRLQASKP